eukprot:2490912-Amphidinium_carterae.1
MARVAAVALVLVLALWQPVGATSYESSDNSSDARRRRASSGSDTYGADADEAMSYGSDVSIWCINETHYGVPTSALDSY